MHTYEPVMPKYVLGISLDNLFPVFIKGGAWLIWFNLHLS